jgi:hypothetical protein
VSKEAMLKVVGVTFVKGYPENILRLRDICEERRKEAIRSFTDLTDASDGVFNALAQREEDPGSWATPIPVLLVRNPANEYDANAIEVHVPLLGRNSMVGHIPRERAARLAPLMDSGTKGVEAEVDFVAVSPENPKQPGLSVKVRVFDLPAPSEPEPEDPFVTRPRAMAKTK